MKYFVRFLQRAVLAAALAAGVCSLCRTGSALAGDSTAAPKKAADSQAGEEAGAAGVETEATEKEKTPDEAKPPADIPPPPRPGANPLHAQLETALGNLSNCFAREQAIASLVAFGDAVVEWLAPFAGDEDERVRSAVAVVFGKGSRWRNEQAFRVLIEMLNDPSRPVRHAAVTALAGYRRRLAREAAELLKSKNALQRAGIIASLARAMDPSVSSLALQSLSDPSAEVRYEALRSIRRLGVTAESVPRIVSLLDDKDLDVAEAAANALLSLDKHYPAVVGTTDILKEIRSRGIFFAAKVIIEHGDGEARGKLFKLVYSAAGTWRRGTRGSAAGELLTARGNAKRRRAARAVREESRDPNVGAFCGIALASSDESVRMTLVTYLTEFSHPVAVIPLVTTLGDENDATACYARDALPHQDLSVVRSECTAALRSRSPKRAALAASVLAEIGDTSGKALLVTALDNPKFRTRIRSAAAMGLAACRDLEVLPRLRAAFAETRRRTPERLHIAAAIALLADDASDVEEIEYLTQNAQRGKSADLALRLLKKCKDKRSVQALMTVVRNSKSRHKALAAEALAEIGDPDTAFPLANTLGRLDRLATEAVARALGSVLYASEPLILSAMKSRNESKVVAAVRTVGVIKLNSATDTLLKMLKNPPRNPSSPLPKTVCEALHRITGRKAGDNYASWRAVINRNEPMEPDGIPTVWSSYGGFFRFLVPTEWDHVVGGYKGTSLPGKPEIRIDADFDPPRTTRFAGTFALLDDGVKLVAGGIPMPRFREKGIAVAKMATLRSGTLIILRSKVLDRRLGRATVVVATTVKLTSGEKYYFRMYLSVSMLDYKFYELFFANIAGSIQTFRKQ